MARRRVSFKVAPGVRISTSSRGVRTSIGNGSGRVSFGAGGLYTSAKVGGVRFAQQHSSSTSHAGVAKLEREQKAATLDSQIQVLLAIERALTAQHLEDFPPAAPFKPEPPEPVDSDQLSAQRQKEAVKKASFFKPSLRKLARTEADRIARQEAAETDAVNQREYEQARMLADAAWKQLLAHDSSSVVKTLDNAFADNLSEATCVDAGIEEGQRYATIVIVFGPLSAMPDRMPATTPGGKPTTKKMTKTERNSLYARALGSTVLATVKEAFATAPALDEARILVLRRDPEASTPANYITAIYSAEFDRLSTNALPWSRVNPAEQLLAAHNARLQRKRATGDVVAIQIDEPGTQELVDAFVKVLRAPSRK